MQVILLETIVNVGNLGEPLRVRREYQRPNTYRAMLGVSF